MLLIFQSNTTDGNTHLISFNQATQNVTLTYEPNNPFEPMYVESVTAMAVHQPHTVLVNDVNLKDMSNTQELFEVVDGSFIITPSSTVGVLDWFGNLLAKVENVDNITIRALPTGEVIIVSFFLHYPVYA